LMRRRPPLTAKRSFCHSACMPKASLWARGVLGGACALYSTNSNSTGAGMRRASRA
jgi:hypothetical protein